MIRILARPVCVEVSCDQNEIGSAAATTTMIAITEAEILPGGVGRLAALWRRRRCEWQWFSWAGNRIVVVAILGPAARQAVTPFTPSSRQVVKSRPRSDTGLFLCCRQASWLTRPLNTIGQGQGQRRITSFWRARHWPVSPPSPDSLRVHGVTLARAVAA